MGFLKRTDTLVPKSESVAADVASEQFQPASCLAAAPARLFESTRKWRKWISSIKRFPSLSLRLCLQDRFSVCCTPRPLALVSNSILKSQSVPQNFLQHVPRNINIIITIILYHVFKTNIHREGKFYTVHAWVASPVSPSCLVCHYTAFQAHRTSFSVSKMNPEKISISNDSSK